MRLCFFVDLWKNVVEGWSVWGGEEQEVEEADEWWKEAEVQQEEADERQEEAYQNSYWKVNHKGIMVLVRDRKLIYGEEEQQEEADEWQEESEEQEAITMVDTRVDEEIIGPRSGTLMKE
jgi:hypothetical protein